MRLSLEQIQDILGVQANVSQDVSQEILAVCRDTNDVTAQSLFVCIMGKRLDGHDFAEQAVKKGAVALLVSRSLDHINVPQLVVEDTVKALGQIAHAWRKQFKGKLIAITGSAGKTTLKECLAHLLKHAGKKVASSILNYNNQIGLPLSMLATNGDEDYWVMEAGISQPQDMDELGVILAPDFALIINAGLGHTEGLGVKGVAWHKAQLLKYINKKTNYTQAFVCSDYSPMVHEAKKLCADICFFSADAKSEFASLAAYKAHYMGLENSSAEQIQGKYSVTYAAETMEFLTPFCGNYGAENVAALFAIMHKLGFTSKDIMQGMTTMHLPKQRFNVQKLGPWCIIDDCYNANVLSMTRMIEALVEQAGKGPCYAVLGAMGELGDLANTEHEKLGQNLACMPISHIFWKGPYAQDVLNGLNYKNYEGKFIPVSDTKDFATHWQAAKLQAGSVLIKGSRSNALEHLLQVILEQIKTLDSNLRGQNAI